jgi:two-component system, chemotaxis family, CheB/CheR fusion protein
MMSEGRKLDPVVSNENVDSLSADHDNRLRNVLAVVRTIIRRTAENSKTVEGFAAHLEGRIDAYARVISHAGAANDRGIDLAVLVAETFGDYRALEGEKFSMEGPDVRLFGKTAESLGLALHELATNAIEHGALGDGGKVEVSWKTNDHLLLEWRESGVPLLRPVKKDGFGFGLLKRGLSFEISAETVCDFTRGALLCEIKIPKNNGWVAQQEQ